MTNYSIDKIQDAIDYILLSASLNDLWTRRRQIERHYPGLVRVKIFDDVYVKLNDRFILKIDKECV